MKLHHLSPSVRVAAVLLMGATAGCGSGSTRGFTSTPAPTPAGRIEQLASLFDFETDGTAG
jgi:hypothetical protein